MLESFSRSNHNWMLESRDHSHIPSRPFAGQSETWHFDALSDDGREAVVVTFNDDYPFSPRAFRARMRANGECAETYPAVTLTYAVDGRILVRTVNEFEAAYFTSDEATGRCSIGGSSFSRTSADYGTGYVLDLELLTPRKCRLKAEFEWVSIESADAGAQSGLFRSVVAPRSDVSGRITRIGRKGDTERIYHFRGTGYLDHAKSVAVGDGRFAASLVGRAHFVDSTAVFQSFHPDGGTGIASWVVLVKDGETVIANAAMETQNFKRDRYGLIYPGRILFASNKFRLRAKPLEPIESGFFKKVMTSEITLKLGDGKPRKTTGMVEFTKPGRLNNRVFRWISGLRIGQNGQAPFA